MYLHCFIPYNAYKFRNKSRNYADYAGQHTLIHPICFYAFYEEHIGRCIKPKSQTRVIAQKQIVRCKAYNEENDR